MQLVLITFGEKMAIEIFFGTWNLVASNETNAEIPFITETEPDRSGLLNWLNGVDDRLLANAKPTSGMVMTIAPDGTFSERVTGKPEVFWFDADGILEEEVTPFDGVLLPGEQDVFLRPAELPKWATPVEGRYGPAILRYDDGDTQVTDIIRLVGGQLIRTVNVVTDEVYLNRVIIAYNRVG